MIIFNEDGFAAPAKTTKLQFSVDAIAERYLLNPSQVFPTADLTVNNYVDPTLLNIYLGWEDINDELDFDMVIWSNTTEYPMTEWSDQGATTANPENDHSIWVSDPDGTYYVSVMDWEAGPFDCTFTICHPNGTIQTITGTFDATAAGVVNDQWTMWDNPATPAVESEDSYRVLKVEHTGETFTITKL